MRRAHHNSFGNVRLRVSQLLTDYLIIGCLAIASTAIDRREWGVEPLAAISTRIFSQLPIGVPVMPLARKLRFSWSSEVAVGFTSERIGSAATEPDRDLWPQTKAK
jgi:hypothetical protein